MKFALLTLGSLCFVAQYGFADSNQTTMPSQIINSTGKNIFFVQNGNANVDHNGYEAPDDSSLCPPLIHNYSPQVNLGANNGIWTGTMIRETGGKFNGGGSACFYDIYQDNQASNTTHNVYDAPTYLGSIRMECTSNGNCGYAIYSPNQKINVDYDSSGKPQTYTVTLKS